MGQNWIPRDENNEINEGFNSTFQYPPYILDLLDSAEVQRTKNVAQLGFVPFVFPNATHSRKAHLIGTTRRALQMYDALKQNGPANVGSYEAVVGSAALLHDIGHPPFSHALAGIIEQFTHKTHEQVSAEIIAGDFSLREFWESLPEGVVNERDREATIDVLKGIPSIPEILNHHAIPPQTVAQVIDKERGDLDILGRNHYVREIIDGKVVDADKLDYLVRDSTMAGIDEVGFSPERIITSLGAVKTMDGVHVAIERDGIESLNFLLNTRMRMYSRVYCHPTVLKIESMIHEGCKRFFRSLPEEKAQEYQRSIFLLDDMQFESFLAKYSEDPIATWLFKTAKYDRRNKYDVAFSVDSRDMRPGDAGEQTKLMEVVSTLEGDFPEDVVRDQILQRVNVGKERKLESHEVIVYSRPDKFLPDDNQFRLKLDLHVYSKKEGWNDPAPDLLTNPKFYDEHLDNLFHTFKRHQVPSYLIVLTPKRHVSRVAKASKEYMKELVR